MPLGLIVLASASVTWSDFLRLPASSAPVGRRVSLVILYLTGSPSGAPDADPEGALNSAVECHLHTVEVAGSNPAAPTIRLLYASGIYLRIAFSNSDHP
jgi:hypothetical protein